MNELFPTDGAHALAPAETPAPGLYTDMSNADYHAAPGVSNSGLALLGSLSPAHYYARRLDPNRPAEPDRAGQLDGTLAHCALFEPEHFEARYAIGPTLHRATKDWKAFASEAAAAGKIAIQQDQYERAWRMRESVLRIPDIAEALNQPGLREASAFWIDAETGELCKCRPDYAAAFAAGDMLIDAKTYSSADPWEFAKQIARKRYHQQAAMYTDGWRATTGRDVLGFVFIAIETDYPYIATPVVLGEDSRLAGRATFRRNLDLYAECRRTGHWPTYTDRIEEVSIPDYLKHSF